MRKIYKGRFLVLRILFSAVIITLTVLGFVFKTDIEKLISGNQVNDVSDFSSQVYFIDVGLGDSTFVKFSDGKTALIDCGKTGKGSVVSEFVSSLGVGTIDYLIYTHQDEDHIGGGATIFNDFIVKNFYRPKVLSKTEKEIYGNPNGYNVSTTKAYDNSILAGYNEDGCVMYYNKAGIEISGSDYSMEFLSPTQDSYTDNNSYSAVIKLELGGKSFLLTGDAEHEIEQELIGLYDNSLRVDVLKVAHHGSKTATSAEYLSYVQPKYAVISVAYRKGWEFPHDEVLTNLENIGAEVYRTDKLGTIAFGVENGILNIDGSSRVELDMPLFVVIMGVLLLVVWGMPMIFKFKKKREKKKKVN